jgi:hypothetical protein
MRTITRFPSSRRSGCVGLVATVIGLAAAGIAYASIPDANGVIHGCYSKDNGSLRAIDPSSPQKELNSCKKRETTLNWNQTGPTGSSGPTGPAGPQGPGATTFTTTVNDGAGFQTFAVLANGVTISGDCEGAEPVVKLSVSTGAHLQTSGTANTGAIVNTADTNGDINGSSSSITIAGGVADFDGLARDSTVGKFAHIDVHGDAGKPCSFWGMIIPSG